MLLIRKSLAFMLFATTLLTMVACAKKAERPVGNCGEYEILYEELVYRTQVYRNANPNSTEQELQEGVKASIAEDQAILFLAAQHIPNRRIDSDEMNQLIDETVKEIQESMGGKSEYKSYLKEHGMTDALMRRLLAITQLRVDLETKLFAGTRLESNETLLAWLDAGNYVRARKLFLPLQDASGSSLKQQAESFALQLSVGTDPEQLISVEQKKQGIKLYPAGYLFAELAASDAERAALSLPANGVSQVIEQPDGYYIYMRVADDRETLVNYQLSTVLDRYRNDHMDALIREAIDQITITWNEYGSSLVLSELD